MYAMDYRKTELYYEEQPFCYRGITFYSVVQALMWHKSRLFPNAQNQHLALREKDPYQCEKKMNQATPNMNRIVWQEKKPRYVKEILKAKYRSNLTLKTYVQQRAKSEKKAKHEVLNGLVVQMLKEMEGDL